MGTVGKEPVTAKKKVNFGIAAHVDAGKTTITERILFFSKKVHKIGEVHDGSTQTDWMKAERERGITIQSAATFFDWEFGGVPHDMNLIDTPGHIDFSLEVERAFRVLDFGVLVLDGGEGVEPQTRTVWAQAQKHRVPLVCFVNKLDKLGGDFRRSYDSLRKSFSEHVFCPVVVPLGEGYHKQADLLNECVYEWDAKGNFTTEPWDLPKLKRDPAFAFYWEKHLDTLAMTDEGTLTKLMSGQTPTPKERRDTVRRGCHERSIFPVMCGSALKNVGVQVLLNHLADYHVEPAPRDAEPFRALVFKVQHLKETGLVCYCKVYGGRYTKGNNLFNLATRSKERPNRLLRMHVISQSDIKEAVPGDIVVMTGLKAQTGETLAEAPSCEPLFPIDIKPRVISMAIRPKRNSNEDFDKLTNALRIITIQDPSLGFHSQEVNNQKELVLSGMGELHLSVNIDLLQDQFGLDLEVGKPQVEYRSTLASERLNVVYLYRNQTGGSGLYGKVAIHFRPLEDKSDYKFINSVVGGRIPNENIPAVDEGIRLAASSMLFKKFPPLYGFSAELYDGDTHPEDGKKRAFEIAGRRALMKACVNNINVMEPFLALFLSTMEEYIGKVTGDVSNKRGRVLRMDKRSDGQVELEAEAPMRELHGYIDHLRSITSGNVSLSYEFSHYEEIPKYLYPEIGIHGVEWDFEEASA